MFRCTASSNSYTCHRFALLISRPCCRLCNLLYLHNSLASLSRNAPGIPSVPDCVPYVSCVPCVSGYVPQRPLSGPLAPGARHTFETLVEAERRLRAFSVVEEFKVVPTTGSTKRVSGSPLGAFLTARKRIHTAEYQESEATGRPNTRSP